MKTGQFVVIVGLLGLIAGMLYQMADRLSPHVQDIQTVPSAPPECVERPIAPHDVSRLSPSFEPLVIERVMIIVIVPDSLFGTPDTPSRDPFIGQQSSYIY